MAENNELSVTRYIAAPPAQVWDVMVNRQNEWWCPVPWRVEVDYQGPPSRWRVQDDDVRPGR